MQKTRSLDLEHLLLTDVSPQNPNAIPVSAAVAWSRYGTSAIANIISWISLIFVQIGTLWAVSTWVPGLRVATRSFTILTSETVTPPTIKMIRRGWSPGWGRFTCKMKESIICSCSVHLSSDQALRAAGGRLMRKFRKKYSWNAGFHSSWMGNQWEWWPVKK